MTHQPREHLPPPLTDAELIRELRRKPYSRVCREAARRLEELTRVK